MTQVVSISQFRKDIFNYINGLGVKYDDISITKDNNVVAKVSSSSITKKTNPYDKLEKAMKKIWKESPNLRSKKNKYLSRDVDKIVYGI